MARIMLLEDHPLILAGVRAILLGTELEVVPMAGDSPHALDRALKSEADILLLGALLPFGPTLQLLRSVRLFGDSRPAILITCEIDDSSLLQALNLGARGIISRRLVTETLPICGQQVALGGQWIEPTLLRSAIADARCGSVIRTRGPVITSREREIAKLVTVGMRNRDIAAKLGLTEATVKITVHRIYEKLGVRNRVELALLMRCDLSEYPGTYPLLEGSGPISLETMASEPAEFGLNSDQLLSDVR